MPFFVAEKLTERCISGLESNINYEAVTPSLPCPTPRDVSYGGRGRWGEGGELRALALPPRPYIRVMEQRWMRQALATEFPRQARQMTSLTQAFFVTFSPSIAQPMMVVIITVIKKYKIIIKSRNIKKISLLNFCIFHLSHFFRDGVFPPHIPSRFLYHIIHPSLAPFSKPFSPAFLLPIIHLSALCHSSYPSRSHF